MTEALSHFNEKFEHYLSKIENFKSVLFQFDFRKPQIALTKGITNFLLSLLIHFIILVCSTKMVNQNQRLETNKLN